MSHPTALIAGSLIVAAVVAGFVAASVWAMGWRAAAGLWALTLAIVAVVTAGALLIGYGITGSLQ